MPTSRWSCEPTQAEAGNGGSSLFSAEPCAIRFTFDDYFDVDHIMLCK